ncbi:unnamed protein product, partial [Iphiclides podalirius]
MHRAAAVVILITHEIVLHSYTLIGVLSRFLARRTEHESTALRGTTEKHIQITALCKAADEFGVRAMAPALPAAVRTYNLIFAIYEVRGRGP